MSRPSAANFFAAMAIAMLGDDLIPAARLFSKLMSKFPKNCGGDRPISPPVTSGLAIRHVVEISVALRSYRIAVVGRTVSAATRKLQDQSAARGHVLAPFCG